MSNMYTIPPTSQAHLKSFRLASSRSKETQAVIYQITKPALALAPLPSVESPHVHNSLADLADALPENSPRFVLLSMPVTLRSGRPAQPYVMVVWMPATCSAEQRMMYAGAREVLRAEAGVGRVLEGEDEEEIMALEEKLKEG